MGGIFALSLPTPPSWENSLDGVEGDNGENSLDGVGLGGGECRKLKVFPLSSLTPSNEFFQEDRVKGDNEQNFTPTRQCGWEG